MNTIITVKQEQSRHSVSSVKRMTQILKKLRDARNCDSLQKAIKDFCAINQAGLPNFTEGFKRQKRGVIIEDIRSHQRNLGIGEFTAFKESIAKICKYFDVPIDEATEAQSDAVPIPAKKREYCYIVKQPSRR